MAVAPAFAPKSFEDLAHMQILQESAMKGFVTGGDSMLELPTIQPPLVRP
jgi:hypothetical protein